MPKRFARDASEFRTLVVGLGSCLATDRITVDGRLVGYMYRGCPDNNVDSGLRFFAGDENEEYTSDPNNFGLYDLNTIANYDPAILSHLDAPMGAAFVKCGSTFIPEAGQKSD